ncbi:hypothetical protein G7Z17_g8018 [Cylindrodendrum hubeiense]|uniref:Protein kinase domain-containing protein n=1 Tax=Cylindrodendrum hubeiense TaxID=595255 RepID=A0A9P5H767_9HYPO|nr:hypothetical protein G7Z17_g8018 [Cylindrodendrum hubeiense]
MADALAKSWAIGIDLGTANTRVAVFRNDEVEIIPDADGGLSMPSCVSFNDVGRLIGSSAKNQAALNPFNTIFSVKRLLGQPITDPEVRTFISHAPFRVNESRGQLVIDVEYLGELKGLTIVEILSMILFRAKENAEAYLKSPVRDAVIGIPPHLFTEHRNAIIDAATIAGIKVLRIMHEPCAVLTACLQKATYLGKDEQIVLVFDLGAGAMNTAVASLEVGVADVQAVASDPHLGGDDFVNRVVNDRLNIFRDKWNEDISYNKRAVRRLRTACESAVRVLSSANEAHINIDALHEGIDFYSTISRARFEELCLDLFRGAFTVIDRVLRDAKLEKSQVNHIILAGGSSRIPRVQKLLKYYFHGKDLSSSMNLDEAEVSGLAMQAAKLPGDTSSRSLYSWLTLEVLPISIGIETRGGMMTKIIPRNTTLPTKKEEIVLLDGRAEFLFIYEGERIRSKDNRVLAKVDLKELHLSGSQEEVLVKCTMDIRTSNNFECWCILTEEKSGYTVKMALGVSGHVSDNNIQRLIADAEQYKMVDDAEAKRASVRDGLDSRITSLFESLQDVAPTEQVGGLMNLVEQIREWADHFPFADMSEYRPQHQKLDNIEYEMILVRRQLDKSGRAPRSVKKCQEMLDSSGIVSDKSSEEAYGVIRWLETVDLAEPAEYSMKIEQLIDVFVQLKVVPELSGNQNDAREIESTNDPHGEAEISSQVPTPDTNESTVLGHSSRQGRNIPENETLESLFSYRFETAREPFTDDIALNCYSDPRHFGLIMEPVGDYNLAEYYYKAKGDLDKISLMRSFFGCLVDALQYLHGARIRHRDIKPQNIIVKGERVLLTDFGIAYHWENLKRGTTTADSGKTLAYAAPEVVRVEARNESADIWSLGCVFLEMVTVLKRESVETMRESFHERSDSYCFHANRDGISTWIKELRGMPPATDNVALDWATSMLQHTPSERPTAAQLFEDIVTECSHSGILFCSPCCLDDVDSATDEDDSDLWGDVGE